MTDKQEPRPDPANVDSDERLLAELRRVASRVDPVPASLQHAARETLTWRRVDAELAELLSDSALTDRRLELVRAEGGPRSVSFEADELTIEIDILADGPRRRLVGQLVPPGAATIQVQSPEHSQSATADDHGRFHAEAIPSGRTRLRIIGHPRSRGPVETSWITI